MLSLDAAEGTMMVKAPDALDLTPFSLPFIFIVAPGSGAPRLSVIVPEREIVLSCARTWVKTSPSRQNNNNGLSNRSFVINSFCDVLKMDHRKKEGWLGKKPLSFH